jgi:protein-tyrosine phosphatase
MDVALDRQLSSYWVAPGRFMAGAHPAFPGASVLPHTVKALLAQGIECFVDLTESGECTDYEDLLTEERERTGRFLEYSRRSIPDMSVPSIERMNEVLDGIDAAHRLDRGVYLHCYGGLGRTGTVVGCHLVRHGLSGPEALDRLDLLRRSIASVLSPSPYTAEQRRFVRSWRR